MTDHKHAGSRASRGTGKHNEKNDGGAAATPRDGSGGTSVAAGTALLDFHRVLHVMEEDRATSANGTANGTTMRLRLDHADSLWRKVEPWIGERDPAQAASLRARLDALQQKYRVSGCTSDSRDNDGDVVDRIFFSSQPTAEVEQQPSKGGVTSESGRGKPEIPPLADAAESQPSRRPPNAAAATAQTRFSAAGAAQASADLQAQQREQMETAIRQMAATLKNETQKIHSNLQNQTRDLDQLETKAEENVQAVSQVAQDVKANVSRGWSRTIGTWTMLFTMLGAFLFCLVTISMIPKQRPSSSCWFFCSSRMGPAAAEEDFCRTVSGKKECISPDLFEQQQDPPPPVPDPRLERRTRNEDTVNAMKVEEASSGDSGSDDADDGIIEDAATFAETKNCQLNMFGECVDEKGNVGDVVGSTGDDEAGAGAGAAQLRDAALREYTERHDTAADGDIIQEGNADAAGRRDNGDAEAEAARLREAALREYMEGYEAATGAAAGESAATVATTEAGGRDSLLTGGTNAENPQQPKKVIHREPIEEGDAFGMFNDENRVELTDNIPVYKGRPFSTKDLRKAAATGDVETLAAYLGIKPGWVDLADKNGWTGLHLAARGGHEDAVAALLKAGADPSLKTGTGQTALAIAKDRLGDSHPMAKLLLPREDHAEVPNEKEEIDVGELTLQDVHNAASFGDAGRLRTYLEARPDWVNEPDRNMWTALHVAARAGHVECVRVLVETEGCDSKRVNNFDKTALDIVVEHYGLDHPAARILRNERK